MKKTVSLILVIALMIGMTSIISGCRKIDSGTEAAKLLLANERLDEKILTDGIDLGVPGFGTLTGGEKMAELPKYYSDGRVREADGALFDLNEYSALNQFESFIINIEHEAKRVAEDITFMKNNVGVVDKWVAVGLEGKQMLRVFDTYDVLLVNDYDGYQNVFYRYTDENANNVYEMYSFVNYDDGENGKIKTIFIPGERYEYFFDHSDGFSDYVIIEKSRGYWVLTRFGYGYLEETGEEFSNICTLMINNDLIYNVDLEMRNIDGSDGSVRMLGCNVTDMISGKNMISFSTYDGTSVDDDLAELEKKLNDSAASLPRDVDEVRDAAYHALVYGEQFGETFEWNGYKMSDLANIRGARAELHKQFADADHEVDSVLDFETAILRQSLDRNTEFADLGIANMGTNSYNDGVISLSGISVEVASSDLIEIGENYLLKVALSLCDEKGNPISVNTVPLADADAELVKANGGGLRLEASGDFTVPKNLHEGDYALVVYAATAADGIRVSDMVKVASFSTYDEKLESTAMDIDVKTVSGILHVNYTIKNSISLVMTAAKDSYTAAELERIMTNEILRCGAPFKGAILEYADGSAISSGVALGKGEYRMMCYLNTSDGPAQSYIYLELE